MYDSTEYGHDHVSFVRIIFLNRKQFPSKHLAARRGALDIISLLLECLRSHIWINLSPLTSRFSELF